MIYGEKMISFFQGLLLIISCELSKEKKRDEALVVIFEEIRIWIDIFHAREELCGFQAFFFFSRFGEWWYEEFRSFKFKHYNWRKIGRTPLKF